MPTKVLPLASYACENEGMRYGVGAREWMRVDRCLRFITALETNMMQTEHPRACKWHEVWTEFRPRTIASRDGFLYEADFVTIWRNRRTRKQTEFIQFRCTGEDLCDVVKDLLLQAENEIECVEDHEHHQEMTFKADNGSFPMSGLFHAERRFVAEKAN